MQCLGDAHRNLLIYICFNAAKKNKKLMEYKYRYTHRLKNCVYQHPTYHNLKYIKRY